MSVPLGYHSLEMFEADAVMMTVPLAKATMKSVTQDFYHEL